METGEQKFEVNQMKHKKMIMESFAACWGKNGNISNLDLYYAHDVIINAPLQGCLRGLGQLKEFISGVRLAFPDMHFEFISPLIAENDDVVGHWMGGGTHTGIAMPEFVGGPLPAATGKKVNFSGITIWKLKDSKIIEEITEEGAWSMFEQLGIVKKL